eukprot:CAMPEP_0202860356 /NCGR_PEP_ID=MMETSP1391-20130828/2094_1 /ASSEMBLY_ACC=CAM_ASM_000867 /TAXON_ID=1034604 /ORGANISM="Chlamydomonas leiostraca, Strain SAG 11-49" /LENGTH=430 /DNA_ID=CAMNT_0049539511 /DNA_START=142 /DNA_END=1434 /DNA_ORIENTATION=+
MAHPIGRAGSLLEKKGVLLALGVLCGYIAGMVIMETADIMFTTRVERHLHTIEAPGSLSQVSQTDGSTGGSVAHGGSSSATSTATQSQQAEEEYKPPAGDTIHSLLTSNGSPYQNFQGRIMYGTYKLVQQMPGGEKLTGFTRVMHRTTPDGLEDEIPTFRATPLHPECDTYCDFPVADRPNAVMQWIRAVEQEPRLLKGAWVLILECDYVWMKPMQAPNAASSAPAMQYHFDYIQVEHPDCTHIIKRLFNGQEPVGKVPNSGPAPALLRFTELKAIAPDWERVTAAIEADPEAVKVLGWVREMYAWDIAVALHPDIKMLTEEPYISRLIVQPPHEDHLGAASMCHYTWGAIYNDTKGEVWRWEKRDYTSPENALKVPHLKMPPHPYQPNTWHLQAHEPVTQRLHETLEAMIAQMNRAIDKLPDLTNKAKP